MATLLSKFAEKMASGSEHPPELLIFWASVVTGITAADALLPARMGIAMAMSETSVRTGLHRRRAGSSRVERYERTVLVVIELSSTWGCPIDHGWQEKHDRRGHERTREAQRRREDVTR